MKRSASKIFALILVLCFSLSLLTGCDWFTTNQDRDMAQVIASVKISDDVEKEDIYKRELVSGYQNYGFQYVYYYGYTEAQAYKTVLDNLIDNRIIIQQSRVELAKLYNSLLNKSENLTDFEKYFKDNATAKGTAIDPKNGGVEDLKKYLTEYEIASAYYTVKRSINQLIDSYVDADESSSSSEKESVSYTDRTSPTATEDDTDKTEEDLKTAEPEKDDYLIADVTLNKGVEALKNEYKNTYDLNMAIWNAYEIDISTLSRKKAYGSLLQYLRDNGLISSTETYDYVLSDSNKDGADNILNYSYFKDSIKSQLENALVAKYEESLVTGVQAKLTDDAVWEQYKVDYANQKALYENDYTAYETALSNANDTSFVLYNSVPGYGYVANLLIGFTEEQKTMLSDYKAKDNITSEEILAFREKLAGQLFAADQRSSWVFNNHGTFADDKFTFEENYTVSELAELKSFIGNVVVEDAKGYTEEDENKVERTKWNVLDAQATNISYNDFVANYLSLAGMQDMRFEINQIGKIENFDETALDKVNDLIYTFSTDPGSLSNEYGYVYSPLTSETTYVKEFAKACKAVVEQGVGSYTAVITDFGVHIIVCTKLVSDLYDVTADGSAFKADLTNEETLAYKYKDVKLNAVTDTEVGKIANQFLTKYREEKVTKYESTYTDLIPTETSVSEA